MWAYLRAVVNVIVVSPVNVVEEILVLPTVVGLLSLRVVNPRISSQILKVHMELLFEIRL